MNRRRLRRVIGVIVPIASIVVVLVVLHGAGVPLTLPGVLVFIVLLIVGRVVFGFARRRSADRG